MQKNTQEGNVSVNKVIKENAIAVLFAVKKRGGRRTKSTERFAMPDMLLSSKRHEETTKTGEIFCEDCGCLLYKVSENIEYIHYKKGK